MNIYDMAREAGVSIATISRVINGKDVVSRKTREKVEKILKKYNYTPNEIARGLVVNSMRTVGVMTIDIRDIYFANVAYTVEQELSKLGYNVMLCNTGESSNEKLKYINTLMQKKVDGIILVGSVFKDESLDRDIAGMAEKVPVVMINGHLDAQNVYSVICDDGSGTSLAVDHLVSKGRKRLAFFRDSDTYSTRAKVEGFKRGLIKNHLGSSENSIINVNKGLDGGYEGVKQLVNNKFGFDGVACTDDITAIGVIKGLKHAGIKIPDEVSVIGFDNSELALCSDPELTSVDSRMNDMGKYAVEIFKDVTEGKKVPANKIIKPELVIRESS